MTRSSNNSLKLQEVRDGRRSWKGERGLGFVSTIRRGAAMKSDGGQNGSCEAGEYA